MVFNAATIYHLHPIISISIVSRFRFVESKWLPEGRICESGLSNVANEIFLYCPQVQVKRIIT